MLIFKQKPWLVKMPTSYIKVIDPVTGKESFVEAPVIAPATQIINQITSAVSPRLNETSTHLGVGVLSVGAPAIFQQIISAIALGSAGDYIGCAQAAIPVLVGVVAALKAIITPDTKGLTHEDIKTAVAAMSRDDLIKLLSIQEQVPTTASHN